MMESTCSMKYSASSYTIWFASTVWRRKTSVLIVLVLTVLLVICMQYNNVTKELVEITMLRQNSETVEDVSGKTSIMLQPKNRVHTVQFVSDDANMSHEHFVDIVGHNNDTANYIKMMDGDFKRRKNLKSSYKRSPEVPYVPTYRLVHLDLKGAPPTLSYLRKLFPLIRDIGATGILLEWEDMFPWSHNLKNMAATNAFSRTEAKEIVLMAHQNKLEIIPAIQTFGHLEFALKNIDFLHLREVPESPQALCPSLNASMDFVQDMIDQIMNVHGDVNFLHIGCDEVYHLGECSRCRNKLKDDLFLSHVSQVARYIRKRYPYVTPIIWDDMLRHVPSLSLEQYNIGKLVEPMVWVYAEDVYRFVPQTIWEKYQTVFPTAWTASAFKGAFGETFYVPNVKRHLENNLNWLSLMSTEEARFQKGFRGMAVTGWQRYDHFATLCETLPASLPSLVVNMMAVSHGYANNTLKEAVFKALNCGIPSGLNSYGRDLDLRGSFLNLDSDPFLWDQFSRCMFSGSQFYKVLYRWHVLEKEINDFFSVTKIRRAWLTDYNIRRNFSIPFRVDELMMEESRIYHNVLLMVQSVNDALVEVFDKYTIAEWIEQKLYPIVLRLEELQKASQRLKSLRTWPRRPLPPLTDLQRIGVTVLENATATNLI